MSDLRLYYRRPSRSRAAPEGGAGATSPATALTEKERSLQAELAPFSEYLACDALFLHTELVWLRTKPDERDDAYYAAAERRDVLHRVLSIHELHRALCHFEAEWHLVIGHYAQWCPAARVALAQQIANRLLPRPLSALAAIAREYAFRASLDLTACQTPDERTLRVYLREFRCDATSDPDSVIRAITRSILVLAGTEGPDLTRSQFLDELSPPPDDAPRTAHGFRSTLDRELQQFEASYGGGAYRLVIHGCNGVRVYRVIPATGAVPTYLAFHPERFGTTDPPQRLFIVPEKVVDRLSTYA